MALHFQNYEYLPIHEHTTTYNYLKCNIIGEYVLIDYLNKNCQPKIFIPRKRWILAMVKSALKTQHNIYSIRKRKWPAANPNKRVQRLDNDNKLFDTQINIYTIVT